MTPTKALEREAARCEKAIAELQRSLQDKADEIIVGRNLLRIAERRREVIRIALEAARELDRGVTADGRSVRGASGEG